MSTDFFLIRDDAPVAGPMKQRPISNWAVCSLCDHKIYQHGQKLPFACEVVLWSESDGHHVHCTCENFGAYA